MGRPEIGRERGDKAGGIVAQPTTSDLDNLTLRVPSGCPEWHFEVECAGYMVALIVLHACEGFMRSVHAELE